MQTFPTNPLIGNGRETENTPNPRRRVKVKLLCDGLMCTPPERPCDDVGRIDASSREALRYASNLLDRPADEMERRVFLGIDLLARCWIAAIMAKPSMTSET